MIRSHILYPIELWLQRREIGLNFEGLRTQRRPSKCRLTHRFCKRNRVPSPNEGLEVGDFFRSIGGQVFSASRSYDNVVFDSNADAAKLFRCILIVEGNVEAGLNGKRDAGLELARLKGLRAGLGGRLLEPRVVNVHAKIMADPVRVVLFVEQPFNRFRARRFDEF